MSMITVKSAKSGDAPNDGPYGILEAANARKLSNLPYLFTLAVTTLLAYFKTATPHASQDDSDQSHVGPQPEKSAPPTLEKLKAYRAQEAEEDQGSREFDEIPQTTAAPSPVASARSNVVYFPYKTALVESPLYNGVIGPRLDPQAGSQLPGADELSALAAQGSQDSQKAGGSADKRKNRAPEQRSIVQLNDVMAGQAVLIGLSELLAQSSDPEGDAIKIANVRVSSGSVALTDNGIVYSSNRQNEEEQVIVTFDVTDGTTTVQHAAYFQINGRTPVVGTSEDDVLAGLQFADTMIADGGNDLIDGRGGNDFISGGAGDDQIMGGSGNDVIQAGAGDDTVFGGFGDDLISGEDGNDRVYGDAGNDTVSGNAGDDLIDGGDGNDHLAGDAGNDRMLGGSGDDTMVGGSGEDTLSDGFGKDVVLGEEGNDLFTLAADFETDRLDGGAGDDRFVLESDGGRDEINGGTGRDVIDMSGQTGAIMVNMVVGTITSNASGTDTIQSIEVIIAGSGNDTFVDADQVFDLQAGAGNDTVVVALDGSADTFSGGTGTDTLDLSSSVGDVIVDLVNGLAFGNEIGSNDIESFETVVFGSGNDTVIADATAMTSSFTITGGDGNDKFQFTFESVSQAQAASLVHQILDFMVGDQLVVADYEFRRVDGSNGGSRIENIYAPDGDEEFVVRLRDVHTGEMHHAIIEVDRDKDDVFEFSLEVFDGAHPDAPPLPSLA